MQLVFQKLPSQHGQVFPTPTIYEYYCVFDSRIWGAVKLHVPMASFTKCLEANKPENTLFEDVNSWHVSFYEMQRFMPLILALFDISPECAFDLVGS